jgi:hypothetical protein
VRSHQFKEYSLIAFVDVRLKFSNLCSVQFHRHEITQPHLIGGISSDGPRRETGRCWSPTVTNGFTHSYILFTLPILCWDSSSSNGDHHRGQHRQLAI